MIPDIVTAEAGNPATRLQEGEHLLVLGPPGGERESWVADLLRHAVPGLHRHKNYLHVNSGFCGENAQSAWSVFEWHGRGANALERRWVFARACKSLTTAINLKKVVVYLERGSGAPELALVQDYLTAHMTPRYERCKLSYLKIMTPDPQSLQAADPWYQARLRAQLGFRSWVNENPDTLTSVEIAARLTAFARKHGCQIEVLEEKQIATLGMNLLSAVGQASTLSPPRLITVTHRLRPGDRPLMLVGKGITFDTGGINLKPHESFVNCMKNDMGGAGLMAHVFMALVESGFDKPLALVIPACENLIDGRSVKPGAIIKSLSGKEVMIEHTDAEGRLILADALTYGGQKLNPALTMVAATLTTASLRQFTNYFTPVHFAPEPLRAALSREAALWGEEFTFWGDFLPFLAGNHAKAADLTNMGRMPSHSSMGGGSNVAAHFLREFAPGPMAHFDIFATTWNWSGDYPGAHYGATGAPLNALFQTLARTPDPCFGMT